MKNILKAIVLVLILTSCSDDDNKGNDCQAKKDSITAQYATQIQYVKDHPGPNGIDTRQIDLLEKERDSKVAKACD